MTQPQTATAVPEEAQRFRYWRRNANTIGVGNLLTNLGWSAAFAFLPLVVKDMEPGDKLELVVIRSGATIKLTVVVGEATTR